MLWDVAGLIGGAFDNAPTVAALPDAELEVLLTKPAHHRGAKETVPAWMPVRLRLNEEGVYRRAARYVQAVSCLVLDLDQGEPFTRAAGLIRGRRAFLHTSWSHRPEFPKGRLVFPLAEPAPVSKWADIWQAAARWAASVELTVDPATKDPSRLYFLPAVLVGDAERRRVFAARAYRGEPLSWRWLLTEYPKPPPPKRPIQPAAVRGIEGQDVNGLRRHFARRVIEVRASELAVAAEGGRNLLAFRAGAAAGQLHAAGVLDLAAARAELVGAALSAGLPMREAEDSIDNGIKRGVNDGAWQF